MFRRVFDFFHERSDPGGEAQDQQSTKTPADKRGRARQKDESNTQTCNPEQAGNYQDENDLLR